MHTYEDRNELKKILWIPKSEIPKQLLF